MSATEIITRNSYESLMSTARYFKWDMILISFHSIWSDEFEFGIDVLLIPMNASDSRYPHLFWCMVSILIWLTNSDVGYLLRVPNIFTFHFRLLCCINDECVSPVDEYIQPLKLGTQIARSVGPTLGPPGADRTQVCPMLAPWTLLSGYAYHPVNHLEEENTVSF